MPAQGVVTTSNTNEVPEVIPTVMVDGGLTGDGMQTRDWITCMAIEDRVGLVPSSAEIKFGNVGYDLTGPNTLNAWQLFDPGARVMVFDGEEPMFLGGLWKRRDQGLSDSLVWTALDDRILLWKIPIRGALVYDPSEADATQRIKFISGYTPRFNPNGYWNCCPAVLETAYGNVPVGTYPVFTASAQRVQTYESPDEAFSTQLNGGAGTLTAWTPRRVLQYLWLLANLPANSVQGTFDGRWRSIASSTRLVWNNDISNLMGKDPSDANADPLDRKMPDVTYRGMKLALGIQHTLNICGTHDIHVDYNKNDSGDMITELKFTPDGFSGTVLPVFMDINLQRGGNCNNPNTGFDFDVFEDSSEVVDAVFVEGARIHAEGRVTYSNTTGDTIKPNYTSAEETCFLKIISGDPATANSAERYCWYPSLLGDTNNSLLADGSSNRPLVYAGTPEAIQFARSFFPKVYKSFRFNFGNITGYDATLLKGYNSAFSNESIYPIVYSYLARKCLPTQLQFMIKDTSGNSSIANSLLQKFPIRVEAYDTTLGAWIDIQATVRFTDDGSLWIDAAEERDGRTDCVYTPSLLYLTDNSAVSLKQLRINIAVPLDHRVKGYKEIPPTFSVLSDGLWNELGGPFTDYIDSPGAFVEDHQVNSYPSQFSQYYAGNTAIDGTSGLNRYLPPGSEQAHADYAAQRRLATGRWPQRRSSWKMVGIRTDYRAGTWIRNVKVYGHENTDVEDTDYTIWAPLKSVVYDFDHQMTLLGGLISQLSYARGTMTRGEVTFNKLTTALQTAETIDRAPRRDPLMDALRGSLGDGGGSYA